MARTPGRLCAGRHHTMIKLFKTSRFTQTFFWTAVAAGLLIGSSGCKQVSSWKNVSPFASRPAAEPFGYSPTDTYFHRPEQTPELTPVPDLPAPGHSVPTDLPPPPAPAEGANSSNGGDSVTAKSKSMWNLRPMSFFQRNGSRSDAEQSAVYEQTRASTADRPTTGTATAAPISPSRFDRHPSVPVGRTEERSVAHFGSPIGSSELSPAARGMSAPVQSQSLDDSYTGPVITPGAQYRIGHDLPIESWPHAPRTVNTPPVVRLRKQSPHVTADAFAPTAPVLNSTARPTELPPSDSATVPLLLPPGP